jgi:hypothetical protein
MDNDPQPRAILDPSFADRDLIDFGSTAAELAGALKSAGRKLYSAYGDPGAEKVGREEALRDLYQARAALNRLITELESTP